MEKETCKNKTRKCGKTLIVIFAAVAAAAVIAAGAAYLYLHSMLGRIRRPGDVPTGGETTNVEKLIGNLPEEEPTETTVPPTTEETVRQEKSLIFWPLGRTVGRERIISFPTRSSFLR